MTALTIYEAAPDLFAILLPPCQATVLSKVLDPKVLYVSLIGVCSQSAKSWIEGNLPPLFGPNLPQSVRMRRLEMDVSFRTDDFLCHLTTFEKVGLDLIQGSRPLPENLDLEHLKPESKAHVFREVGIVLQFYLPHPHENALITSPTMEVLHRIQGAFAE